MRSTSTLYTMGMALDRAADNGYEVELLVDGQWLTGFVAANDGVGVVLESAGEYHAVVRAERITAVRVHAESPYRAPLARGTAGGGPGGWGDAAMPMPGPRAADG